MKSSNAPDIIDYYNKCQWQYDMVWNADATLSLHYGYHDRHNQGHTRAIKNMNHIVATIAKVTTNDKVLDMGCGVGGSAIMIAKEFGAIVTGININEMQLNRARASAEKCGVSDHTTFLNRDYIDTELPNESFDVVWAIESFCHAENKQDVLTEVWRVLKRGGRLIVADAFKKKLDSASENPMDTKEACNRWAIPDLAEVNQFSQDLQNIGFHNIQVKDIKKAIWPSARRLYRLAIMWIPLSYIIALGRKLFGEDPEVEMKNIRGAYYQYTLLQKGLWTYCIYYAEKKS
jgi:ubiquinone/menaquinone biosynthesis C-methylase UbiE